MRWMVFQTSLGRLDESALAINILFVLLISFLMLLRKDLSHKASLWEGVCDFLPPSHALSKQSKVGVLKALTCYYFFRIL